MTALALVVLVTLHAGVSPVAAGDTGSGDRPPSDASPPVREPRARAGPDAGSADQPQADPRAAPRPFEDAEPLPRAGEGCPYRGRKLDLIV